MTDEDAGNLVTVKVGTDGLELALSNRAPGLLARILPRRILYARQADDAIAAKIVSALRLDEPLTEADLQFAEAQMGESAVRYIRTARIAARADEHMKQLVATQEVKLLAAKPETESGASEPAAPAIKTSSDWVNRFRDDTGLVDDETLQEIYAQILAQESKQAGTTSLSTLRVLRYLDREAAEAFADVQQFVINGRHLPQEDAAGEFSGIVENIHVLYLRLVEAGLLAPIASQSSSAEAVSEHGYFLRNHGRFLRVRSDSEKFHMMLPVRRLSTAGMELARIAKGPNHPTTIRELAVWFKRHAEVECKVTVEPIFDSARVKS